MRQNHYLSQKTENFSKALPTFQKFSACNYKTCDFAIVPHIKMSQKSHNSDFCHCSEVTKQKLITSA